MTDGKLTVTIVGGRLYHNYTPPLDEEEITLLNALAEADGRTPPNRVEETKGASPLREPLLEKSVFKHMTKETRCTIQ